MNAPTILLKNPEPKITQKQFHGKKLMVWEGMVNIGDVVGWVSNPRLDLELKKFKDQHTGREPDNEEAFAIMKSMKEFRLKELADDIRVNGVRQRIIITVSGGLLDGNRRYYAARLVLEAMKKNDPTRSDYEVIPAWVLHESCTKEDEERILVQENFYSSLKVEWPDYVKAQHIYADLQKGDPVKTVAQRYNWNTSKVGETKTIMELIEEFVIFATTEPEDEQEGLGIPDIEAERIAAENYQYFNEAQKSFRRRLDTDLDFKQQFFRWIYEGKFSSFPEVRIAEKAWDHDQAKRILMSDDPKAGQKARALIDYEKTFEKELINIEEEINKFVNFLGELSTDQKTEISEESFNKLENALSMVVGMIRVSKGENG